MDARQHIANVSREREFTFAENCSADARYHSVNVMTQYFLLSLWSSGHISYTVVKTRLQVVESCRTYTMLFVLCLQQAQHKQLRFT